MHHSVTKPSRFFLELNEEKVTLWDVIQQEKYLLDDVHLHRIIEICKGDDFDDSDIDQTIKSSCIFNCDRPLAQRKWDVLAFMFHFGTRITLKPGEALPTEDTYEGYLDYCTAIAENMPELEIARDGCITALPAVTEAGMQEANIWTTLKSRKTCRDFDASPIGLTKFAEALYWSFGAIHGSVHVDLAAAGLIPAGYRRTSPSAGSLQATEIYVAALRVDGLAPGIYHYRSQRHELTLIDAHVEGEQIGRLLGAQMFAKDVAFGVFFTSRFEKLWWKYPNSRAYRVALLDVGALLQTFLLVCTALGLKTWPTGHFFDDEVNTLLGVDGVKESTLFFAGAGGGTGSPFSATARETIARALKRRQGPPAH